MSLELDILVVGAHPDDAEIGCGGTIAHYIKMGKKVGILDLSNGEPTPFGTVEKRMAEAQNAADILRVNTRITLDLTNRYIENTIESRIKVSEVFRKFRPKVIITHPPTDYHPDHVACHHLVNAAKFQSKLSKTESKLPEYYPPIVIYFDHSHMRKQRKVDFLVDISDSYDEKIRSLKAYKSQFVENKSHSTLFEWLEARCRYLGSLIKVDYAEGFISPEFFMVQDLTKLRN